ncbi:hypothetical protein [Nonomuraea lactucae]|uniref:hypothetical protein n=1 Tax=Nonomuraea lactucae TaxID=2249762 RepID=UPI000DE1F956|nr:hypothetical protein [Nonomuraea lactucae]
MDDVDTVVSILAGIVTVVSGLVGLVKWSDRHSPNTASTDRGHFDPAIDWVHFLIAGTPGILVFILASSAFGLSVVAATLLGVAVAAVVWMLWWFTPL